MRLCELSVVFYLLIFICVGCAFGIGNYVYDEWWLEPPEKDKMENKKEETPIPYHHKKGEKKL